MVTIFGFFQKLLITFSGEETRIIPRILGLRGAWKKSEREWKRLQEAGVTNEVINSAISSFIIQVSPLIFVFNRKVF